MWEDEPQLRDGDRDQDQGIHAALPLTEAGRGAMAAPSQTERGTSCACLPGTFGAAREAERVQ